MRRRHAAFNPGQFTAIRLALKYIDRRASQMPGAQDCRQFLRIGNSSSIHFDRVHPEPTLVKYHLVLSPKQPLTSGQRPLLFGVRRDLMRVIGGNCTLPTIRIWHTTPLTAPICACIQPTHAPPLVPSPQRRITTPMFGRTPVRGSALHRHPQCAPTDYARLPLSGLRSGQTQVQGLSQTPLPEQPAAAQTPSPAAVSAAERLPVHLRAHIHVPVSAAPSLTLWLRCMFFFFRDDFTQEELMPKHGGSNFVNNNFNTLKALLRVDISG